MKKKQYVVVLVHVDMEHGDVGDIFEGVGDRGKVVNHVGDAKRYGSLKRALNAAQDWRWYADIVRVMEVES